MKNFKDIEYIANVGYMGVGMDVYYDNVAHQYIFPVLEPCVLRLAKAANASASFVKFEITVGTSVVGVVVVDIRGGQYAYCDITDILRASMVKRSAAPLGFTLAVDSFGVNVQPMGAWGDIVGNPLNISIHICGAWSGTSDNINSLTPSMPSEIRTFGGGVVSIRPTPAQVGGNATIRTVGGGIYTTVLSLPVAYTTILAANVASFDFAGQSIYVVRENCTSDKLEVFWWSPTLQAKKSIVCEVLAINYGNDSYAELYAGFNNIYNAEGVITLSCRVGGLNANDLRYYSDLLTAGDVYIVRRQGLFNDNFNVRLKGGDVIQRLGKGGDINFTLMYNSYNSLW